MEQPTDPKPTEDPPTRPMEMEECVLCGNEVPGAMMEHGGVCHGCYERMEQEAEDY